METTLREMCIGMKTGSVFNSTFSNNLTNLSVVYYTFVPYYQQYYVDNSVIYFLVIYNTFVQSTILSITWLKERGFMRFSEEIE